MRNALLFQSRQRNDKKKEHLGVPLVEKHSGRASRSVAAAEKRRQATRSNPSRKNIPAVKTLPDGRDGFVG